MKITPIEIRQKSFEKVFRGYDKEEVDAFLLSLSQEWERVIDENKENRIRLEVADKEVKKLREVETSLYKTLKTAEDTGAHLIDQANKSAAMHMKEAQVKADSLLREARSKAQQMVQDADSKAKQALQDTVTELKSLEMDIRNIENQRDNLLAELKNIVHDVLEKVNRIDAKSKKISFESKVSDVRNYLEQRNEPPAYIVPENEHTQQSPATPETEHVPAPEETEQYSTSEKQEPKSSSSFFDEIGS